MNDMKVGCSKIGGPWHVLDRAGQPMCRTTGWTSMALTGMASGLMVDEPRCAHFTCATIFAELAKGRR